MACKWRIFSCAAGLFIQRIRALHSQSGHVLTASEALRALRPFYMAVHPDRFSRFPREKAANEESLKRLHSYLDSLENQDGLVHKSWSQPKAIDLTFFIHPKTTDSCTGDGEPNAVGISLNAQSRGAAIHDILESCDLSVRINSVTRAKLARIKESIQLKDHILSMYSHYHSKGSSSVEDVFNYPDFEAMFQERNSRRNSTHDESLPIEPWLKSNIAQANSASSYELRTENQALVDGIIGHHCGVEDVRFDVDWTAATLRGHLLSLKELLRCGQVLSVLEGYGRDISVYLGYRSFMDVNGCLHLNCEHTLQQWSQFFSHAKMELATLKEIMDVEDLLTQHLPVDKFERPSHVSLQDYRSWITVYLHHCKKHPATEHYGGGSTTLMLWPHGVCEGPFVADNGTVNLSPSCSLPQLFDFLRRNEQEIKEKKDCHEKWV